MPNSPPADNREALAVRYEQVAAGFRSIQKDLEALPKSPDTTKVIWENLENIATAEKNVRIIRGTGPMATEQDGELRSRIAFFERVIASIKEARKEMRLGRLMEMNGEMLKGFEHSLAIAGHTLEEEADT